MKLLLLLVTAVALAAAEDKPIRTKDEEEKVENVEEENKSNKTEKRALFGLGVYDGGNYVDGSNQGYHTRGAALDLLGGAQYSGAGQVAPGYNVGHLRSDQGTAKNYVVIPVPVPVTRPYPVPAKSQGAPLIFYIHPNSARGHGSSSGLYTGGYNSPIAQAAHPGVGYYYSNEGAPAYTHYGANSISGSSSSHNSPSINYEGHGKGVTLLEAIRPNVGYSNAPSGGSDSHYGYYRSHYARSVPPPSNNQNSIGGYSASTGSDGRNYVYDRPVYSHGSGASEQYTENSIAGSSGPNDVAYTTPGRQAGIQYEYVDPRYLASLTGASTANNVGYSLGTNQGYADPSYGSSVPSNQNSEAYTANTGIAHHGYVDSSYLGSTAGSAGNSGVRYSYPSGSSDASQGYSHSSYLQPSAGSSSHAAEGYNSPASSSGSPFDQSVVNYAEQTQVYISPNVRYAGPGSYLQYGQKYSAGDYATSKGSGEYKVSEKQRDVPPKASDTKSNAAYNEYDSSRYSGYNSGSSGSSSAGYGENSNTESQNSAAYQTYLFPNYSSGIQSGSEKAQPQAYTTEYSSSYNNPSADYSRSEEQQSSSAYTSPSENNNYANSRG